MANKTRLEFPADEIAVLTFDNPEHRANVLSRALLDELRDHLRTLRQREGLRGLVLTSAKEGFFIAGADISEFLPLMEEPKQAIHDFCEDGIALYQALCQGPWTSVAAIAGFCLGGGAELASWCDYRILARDAKTKFGFPEVKLGLIPGWGGTVRSARIAGLASALGLVAGGEPIDADQAEAMGFANQVVGSADELVPAALDLLRAPGTAAEVAATRTRLAGAVEMPVAEKQVIADLARQQVIAAVGKNHPAPLTAIDIMLAGTELTAAEACLLEAGAFSELFGSPESRALINVFFLQDHAKKTKGTASDVAPRDVQQVGVIGTGIMGSGILAANLKRRKHVTAIDDNAAALEAGTQQALEEAAFDRNLKGPNPQKLEQLRGQLVSAADISSVANCDLVIEAVVEDAAVKRNLLTALSDVVSADAVLASNTSTIRIETLAADMPTAERIAGLHFFYPVRKMQVVEVIRGAATSDATIATLVGYAKSLGKMPVVCGDCAGFLVNRVLSPYLNEALLLLTEGAPLEEIERAALAFGMPMGPFSLLDAVGLDTAVHAGKVLAAAYPRRFVASELLAALFKQGRLGRKAGRGFFRYDDRGEPQPDADVAAMIEDRIKERPNHSQQSITDRLFLPMLTEAFRTLEEGFTRHAKELDLAVIFGIGFPAYLGGIFFWADRQGAANVVAQVEKYEQLGQRFAVPSLLAELAASGRKSYELPERELASAPVG